MSSPECELAISDAERVGKAVLKFISPNDVGLTKSHQAGYYLPHKAWPAFTTFPPTKGFNNNHPVEAIWPDGLVTASTVKWYGTRSRYEYRLTGFNRIRKFPFRSHDRVGSLLILIPEQINRFLMYVLDHDEDIDELQSALGVEAVSGWALYDRSVGIRVETENECIEKRFIAFVSALTTFPKTIRFAEEARGALVSCAAKFMDRPSDDQLMRCVEAEYALFQLAEKQFCEPLVKRAFKTIDEFLLTAQTILQRRKSRAGYSLEHHVERILRDARIPFDRKPVVDGTEPDILIPGKDQYDDPTYPLKKLFMVGVKTTCKDRWRQVLEEAPRMKRRHVLTIQKGFSPKQLADIKAKSVSLIVPSKLQDDYPPAHRSDLLSIESFIEEVRATLK